MTSRLCLLVVALAACGGEETPPSSCAGPVIRSIHLPSDELTNLPSSAQLQACSVAEASVCMADGGWPEHPDVYSLRVRAATLIHVSGNSYGPTTVLERRCGEPLISGYDYYADLAPGDYEIVVPSDQNHAGYDFRIEPPTYPFDMRPHLLGHDCGPTLNEPGHALVTDVDLGPGPGQTTACQPPSAVLVELDVGTGTTVTATRAPGSPPVTPVIRTKPCIAGYCGTEIATGQDRAMLFLSDTNGCTHGHYFEKIGIGTADGMPGSVDIVWNTWLGPP